MFICIFCIIFFYEIFIQVFYPLSNWVCLLSFCWVLRVLWLLCIQVLHQKSPLQIVCVHCLDIYALFCLSMHFTILWTTVCVIISALNLGHLWNQQNKAWRFVSLALQILSHFCSVFPSQILWNPFTYLITPCVKIMTPGPLIFQCLCFLPCYHVRGELFIWL